MDRTNLRNVLEGRAAFSLKSAKAVSAAAGGRQPVALFVSSQAVALKGRADQGDLPGVLKGIGGVFRQLEDMTPEDLEGEGKELAAAIHALTAILNQARDQAEARFGSPANTPDAANPAKLSNQLLRDAYGAVRRHEKATKKARDAFGMLTPQGTGIPRDGYGRKA